jgi:hypothetical protein
MGKKNTTINRNVSVSDFQVWRANNDKTVKHLRKSITERVGGQYLPRALSKETRKKILLSLTERRTNETVIDSLEHTKVRSWIAERCNFEYNPNDDRHYGFLKEELQKIEFVLQQREINNEYEVEAENPKRCKRMRIDK